MNKYYDRMQAKNGLKTKLKTIFYSVAALCCMSTVSHGQTGAALNFDGSNDYVSGPVLSSATSGITMEAKVFWNGTSSGSKFIFYNGNTGANGYGLFIPSNSSTLNYLYGGITLNGTFSLTPNVWTSLAMVITSNTLTIYKDGVIGFSAVVGNAAVPIGAYTIGSDNIGGSNFNGSIDEVRFWNVARTQCDINTFKDCEIPTSATNLVANYHFNQGTASSSNATVTTLTDFSGNSNNLTLTNFALTGSTSNWVSPGGVVSGFTTTTPCSLGGAALNFDGVNDHINAGNLAGTQFSGVLPYTIETWIRPATGFTTSAIAGMFNSGVSAAWALFLNADGSLQSYRNVGPFSLTTPTNVIVANVWSHIATTYDGINTLSIFVNGQLVATSTGFSSTQPSTTAPLLIGARLNSSTPDLFFNGDMDEFRVWNVARSQCQINTFRNCEIPTSATNLVANYHFNYGIPSGNNTGVNTSFDVSGSAFNGTLTNFALSGSTSNWVAPGAVANSFTTTLASLTPTIVASGATTLCAPNSVTLRATNNASALDFSGINSEVSIPHSAGQSPSTELTLEAWVFIRSTAGGGSQVMMKGNYGYAMHIGANGCSSGNKINYWTSSGCGSAIASTGTVPLNVWTHVAIVVNTSPQSVQFYINGVPAGLVTSGVNINNGGNGSLMLGVQGTGCACNRFDGKMDEIRVWNIARTQSQIIGNMNSSISASSPNLQVYLKADNISGTTVTDLSSNASNGTLTNVTWESPSTAPVNATTGYLWSSAATTSSINVSTTSTNSYTLTGSNGCTSTASQSVIVNPAPTLSVNSGAICSGQNFTMVPSGASTYTFQSGTSVKTPTANTSYTVVGTSSAGCVSSGFATSNVTVNALPTVSVNSGAICSGSTFTIAPSGAGTYTISGGSSLVTPTSNTSYAVTGTSSLGCVSSNTAISSVTVSALPVVSVNSGSICNGQSFTISPAGANTYTVQGGSFVVSPNSNLGYTVSGTSSLGCISSSVAISNVTVLALPTISVNSGSICNGQSFTINPSGANTYTVQGGSFVVSPNSNLSYTVAGTSTAGCLSQSFATAFVIVNANPTITVNSGAICAGKSFTLIPTGASNYTFQGGNAVVSPTANTSYSVIGLSSAGCVSSTVAISSVTVNTLPLISATTSSSVLCNGQTASLTASGAASYTWNTNASAAVIAVSPSVTTTYTVNGTDNNGCSNVSAITQSVSACTGIDGLTKSSLEGIIIYPNPNNGIFTVRSEFEIELSILNELGQLVKTVVVNESNNYTVSINEMANGIYLLIGQTNNGLVKQKIIVSK